MYLISLYFIVNFRKNRTALLIVAQCDF